MPRPLRLEFAGVPLHIIQRGNNRSHCFCTDGDRLLYLRCLGEAASQRHCAIHAYVLMPNHVHLLVTPGAKGAASRMMQDVGRRYVRLFNANHKRTGTLWEGRFKSSLIENESYLLTCHSYIEQNPVRAGLVAYAADYRWSSHRHYALGFADVLVSHHPIYERLGNSHAERNRIFKVAFNDPIASERIDEIRNSANRGLPLGGQVRVGTLI